MASRYHKKITPDADGLIDLYAIAEAFGVKSNPQFHAMKRIMMAGERGHKSLVQDIDEAIIAAQRWKEMVQAGLVAVPQDEAAATQAAMDALHNVKPPLKWPCPICGKEGCRTLHRPAQFNCPPLCSKCHTLHHASEGCRRAQALVEHIGRAKPEPFHPDICPGCYTDPKPHPRSSECAPP